MEEEEEVEEGGARSSAQTSLDSGEWCAGLDWVGEIDICGGLPGIPASFAFAWARALDGLENAGRPFTQYFMSKMRARPCETGVENPAGLFFQQHSWPGQRVEPVQVHLPSLRRTRCCLCLQLCVLFVHLGQVPSVCTLFLAENKAEKLKSHRVPIFR